MKDYIRGAIHGVMAVAIGASAFTVFAQAPAPPVPATITAATVNSLDETDRLLVQVVSLHAQLANCQSEQLESMKAFASTRTAVVKRIEEKHPGYTLDLQTGKLVAKVPAK